MEKIKRFIDCYIPTETCNLKCHYCYITQQRKFNNKLASFSHSPEEIRKALSKKRLGGTCLLNLCAGGETLLSSEVLPAVRQLILEGHYVMIVTNGTVTKRFEEVAQWPRELLSHLFFKFSFHFLELNRLNASNRFFDNVRRVRDAGASFTVEITPSDELIPYIDEVKRTCMENLGAICHVTIARDDKTNGIDVLSSLCFEDYIETWKTFDSALFDFKSTIFYQHRNEFCYAGEWSAYLNLDTGVLRQCYCGKELDRIYENVNMPIHFEAVGHDCKVAHCYNGHAFLTLGNIPELDAPTYAETRNRVCKNGSEWLKPEMKAIMSSRLCESNNEYSFLRKAELTLKQKHIGKRQGEQKKRFRKVRSYLSKFKPYQQLSKMRKYKNEML